MKLIGLAAVILAFITATSVVVLAWRWALG
jgi:hypothetical protein